MTYAGAYDRNDRVPVDRVLRREGHPLGVRRDEATRVAAAEAEAAATTTKRWTFGVAAGALLMAGTFAAGALGITGGAAPTVGAAPEHAPAAPGHGPGSSGPVAGAPAQEDVRQQPQLPQEDQETSPASADPRTGGSVSSPAGTEQGVSGSSGPGGTGGTGTQTPAPQPSPAPAPPQSVPQQSAPQEEQQGALGQVVTPVVETVDDVLSPVTDTVGGLLSAKSAEQTAPGPALTMINPLGDLLGV